MSLAEKRRFFGAGLAVDAVRACLRDAEVVRIASAFFEPGGWELLADVLEAKDTRILLGREEGAADRMENLLREFFEELQAGYTTNQARLLPAILRALKQGKLAIRIAGQKIHGSLDVRYLYHHAKLYIADEKQLVVTSANFTRSGLTQSREAGYLVTDIADVRYFVETFDEFFASAQSLTEVFIEALEELLDLREPRDVYHRALLEIYGLSEDAYVTGLPEPAYYQKPVISRLVRSLTDYGGAFLVASTGLGKTVIAAHTVAILRASGVVQAALIVAPAGLRDMWASSMRSARISSREYSYHNLSSDDWQKYRNVMLLDDELNRDLNGVLIILDESHHMRNDEDSERERSLRHERISKAVAAGAKLLLLTATPYSRSVDDINNQLGLLPARLHTEGFFENQRTWQVERPSELSELAPCTVLTAPTVVRHFSHADDNGKRYVQFGELRRYFPDRIHLKTIEFENPMTEILRQLFKSGLLRRRTSSDYESDIFGGQADLGRRDPLLEARLLHQFCSSPAQVVSTLEKLQTEGGFTKLRFQSQAELTALTLKLIPDAKAARDLKLETLREILAYHEGEKIVIFCIYRETARYLAEELGKAMTDRRIRSTVDVDADALETLLDSFAPIANGKILPEKPDNAFTEKLRGQAVDILIASEAISEGYNLQDSRILINYDLPWSVLQLAQRMGRLMRPWHEVRDLYVYNFLPDTMFDSELKHGPAWHARLDKRSRDHASFANLPVILPRGDEAVNMYNLSAALKDHLSTDLELAEAMEFVSNATQIETSSALDDLANLPAEESRRVLRLQPGFRSRVRAQAGDPALFLLIQRRSSVFPALFKANGEFFAAPHGVSLPLEVLRACRSRPVYSDQLDPAAMDRLQEKSLGTWLKHFHEVRAQVRILCALHFA